MCPVTGQPDFARIDIDYVPDRLCVESKSLKFYLASYRNERAFNEAVTNRILDDFAKACAPRKLPSPRNSPRAAESPSPCGPSIRTSALEKSSHRGHKGHNAVTIETSLCPLWTECEVCQRKEKMKRAVVLLSGGIDSTTTVAIAIAEGYEAYALSFDYGQRHKIETEAARRVAGSLGTKEHRIAKIDLRVFGDSALTDDIAVPKQRSQTEIARGVPVTDVPARNTIFLAYALAWAMFPANDIFIGVNAIDYSGYPDCRPEFIEAFENLANLGTKAGVEGRRFEIHTPLIKLSKAEIICKAVELGVDLSLTHSCYDPTPKVLPAAM